MDWTSSQSRRRFMAFGVAGAIPFVAGGRRLLAQRPSIGSARPARDPVIDQLTREMGRVHASIKQNGLRGEHVHAFAGHVRVMLAHAEASGLDDRVERGLGAAIDRSGRDAIIDTSMDDSDVRAQLAPLGVDTSDFPPRRRLERSQRAELVDSLLVGGVTPHLARLEAALSKGEEKANRFGADVRGPHAIVVQDCWQAWGGLIDVLSGAADFFAWFAPELAGWFALAAVMCEVCMYVTCWGG